MQRLRPVQFRSIAPFADDRKPIHTGCIAEEVEEVLPELVAYGADGRPSDADVRSNFKATFRESMQLNRCNRQIGAAQ